MKLTTTMGTMVIRAQVHETDDEHGEDTIMKNETTDALSPDGGDNVDHDV